jgi:Acetyltransferase (GNAT) domain
MLQQCNVNSVSVPCVLCYQVMIAEATYRGKGYAREAVAMLMRYGVESLGVTRYFCKVTHSCFFLPVSQLYWRPCLY